MILIALGSNQSGPWGTPHETVMRARAELDSAPLRLIKSSTLITTKPFGITDQPDFINAVAEIATDLSPQALLAHIHKIENSAGRKRSIKWGPRTLDLDIVDYHGAISTEKTLQLPHPGIADRDFVLRPIAEIAPAWRHPVLKLTAQQMLDQRASLSGN